MVLRVCAAAPTLKTAKENSSRVMKKARYIVILRAKILDI
jgi:hypothetical protein